MSALTVSTSNSYQSLSSLTIMCPVCLEEKENKDSFMANCNHSWCNSCNENLNKNNIDKCPMCKKVFIPFIKNGKWEIIDGNLRWKRGISDSQSLVKWRNRQAYFYNLFGNFELHIEPGGSLGGISV